MNYSFFALITLCVTTLAIVAMVLCFCYKQEKNISLHSKAQANKDEVYAEIALDIDKEDKQNKKENSK
jgi:hypothetical protein